MTDHHLLEHGDLFNQGEDVPHDDAGLFSMRRNHHEHAAFPWTEEGAIVFEAGEEDRDQCHKERLPASSSDHQPTFLNYFNLGSLPPCEVFEESRFLMVQLKAKDGLQHHEPRPPGVEALEERTEQQRVVDSVENGPLRHRPYSLAWWFSPSIHSDTH